MRIIDWSSDVCSSDLCLAGKRHRLDDCIDRPADLQSEPVAGKCRDPGENLGATARYAQAHGAIAIILDRRTLAGKNVEGTQSDRYCGGAYHVPLRNVDAPGSPLPEIRVLNDDRQVDGLKGGPTMPGKDPGPHT